MYLLDGLQELRTRRQKFHPAECSKRHYQRCRCVRYLARGSEGWLDSADC